VLGVVVCVWSGGWEWVGGGAGGGYLSTWSGHITVARFIVKSIVAICRDAGTALQR